MDPPKWTAARGMLGGLLGTAVGLRPTLVLAALGSSLSAPVLA